MSAPPVTVTRMPDRLFSDDRRVVTRPFIPGSSSRIQAILNRVLHTDDDSAALMLVRVLRDFSNRHKDIKKVFLSHFEKVARFIGDPENVPIGRRLLIGAYFTMEYSVEAAALFNPSIVPHPDQSGVPSGDLRFIMSLRATGEGHVSSVAFRTGMVCADGSIEFDPISRFVEVAEQVGDRIFHKQTFFLKLIEMGAYNDITGVVLDGLAEEFHYDDLLKAIEAAERPEQDADQYEQTADRIRWLAHSNYRLTFPKSCDVSEVVIFPVTENESRGIEDARFVRFVEDDGSVKYYGTYTAYNGFNILPQLITTTNFTDFEVGTLNGKYAQNKGAALFPRKVGDWYMMVSRVDGENMYIMRSSNIRFWNEAKVLQVPSYPWEFVQIGNCGSPIETDQGWVLLTHGVGPMRQYCIGASLLDLNDPTRIIGQTPEPLLVPNEREREGYVPNVVYSCGALVHDGVLVMPYAMSDSATSMATIPMDELLAYLKQ